MLNNSLPRLDRAPEIRDALLPYCRLQRGETWRDPLGQHVVACMDAASPDDMAALVGSRRAALAVQDPPYNLVAFENRSVADYVAWCRRWVDSTASVLLPHSSLYIWLGADQTDGFQPLPDFMIMMRATAFQARSFITMRNQRGYGTQQNWMAVRQELLYYMLGSPEFDISAEATEIPKILRGYYKEVSGRLTENTERSKSPNIRAGNVWVDIQQVFYRMQENVNGCYAQKPLKAIERVIRASSTPNSVVLDSFSHSGTTLLACEILERRCATCDIDPVFCEISIRRLEHYRTTGQTGWQNSHPFEGEQRTDKRLAELLGTLPEPAPTLFDVGSVAAQQSS